MHYFSHVFFVARYFWKREVKGGGGSQGRVDKEWWASAQEPERADWGKRIWIATLNVDGLRRQGKREKAGERMRIQNFACLISALLLMLVFFVY